MKIDDNVVEECKGLLEFWLKLKIGWKDDISGMNE